MKKQISLILGITLALSFFLVAPATVNADKVKEEAVAIYRLYNSASNEYLYSSDKREVKVLDATDSWKSDGIAWYAPTKGEGVYRLFNPATGIHLFTSDKREIKVLDKNGWEIDNNNTPMFYSGGNEDICRFYNGTKAYHFLTGDNSEIELVKNAPDSGWAYEGPKFKAVSVPAMKNPIEIPDNSSEGAAILQELSKEWFSFLSGAGGWSSDIKINPDGSFEGSHHDSDMGDISDSYPYGTEYFCKFSGKFSVPVRVNEYTFSMRLESVNLEQEPGKTEIRDGVRYITSTAYGLDDADEILIYLPGTKVSDLPEEFSTWIWWRITDYNGNKEEKLPKYGLYNVNGEQGWSQ